jgi:hypothetical protein
MKKHIALALMFLCLGMLSWGQSAKTTLFDTVKSGQELEIMKGILGTTLSFVAQNIQKQQATTKSASTPFAVLDYFRTSNINAFYLYGQGAVFVVPTSSLRFANLGNRYATADGLTLEMEMLSQEMEMASQEMAMNAAHAGQGVGGVSWVGGVSGGGSVSGAVVATGKSPSAKAQTATPAPTPKTSQASQEEMRKKLAEVQEKIKKSKEDAEAAHEKFIAVLGDVKSFLIEALANHGDSLTTVKPNEYITLVFSGASELFDSSGDRNRQDIISVQKSWIADYKAGRLSLDAFKQKALQYSE